MKNKLIIYIGMLLALWLLYWWADIGYVYSDFKEYLLVLLTASGLVFTIMGLWIAFLYPTAMKRIAKPSKEEEVDLPESLNEIRRLESLAGSVIRSAIVVVMILMLFLGRVIFSQVGFSQECLELIKTFMLSFACVLSVLQVESIYYVIMSNVFFLTDLHEKREKIEGDKDLNGG